jgi:predicted DNA-binding protein
MSQLQALIKNRRSDLPLICPLSEHRKLSMLAARTGRKKVDIVRMLLEDGLKEVHK